MKYWLLRLGTPVHDMDYDLIADLERELATRMPKAGHVVADNLAEVEVALCVSLPPGEHQPIAEGMALGKPTVVLERVHPAVPGLNRWIVRPVNIWEEQSIALDTPGAVGGRVPGRGV